MCGWMLKEMVWGTSLMAVLMCFRFVKFQNVTSLQLFFEENQDDSEVTFVNSVEFVGVPIDGESECDGDGDGDG